MVCECASSDTRPIDGHLSPSQVAELVDAARPRAVWLTHLFDDPDHAVQTVARTGIPVRRADDLDTWTC